MPRLFLIVLLSSSPKIISSSLSTFSTTIPSLLLISSLPSPSLPSRLSPRSTLCGGSLDLQTYLFMNQVASHGNIFNSIACIGNVHMLPTGQR